MPYHLQLNRIIQYVNDHCFIGPRGLPCGDTLSGNEVDILKQGLQVCCNPDECFLFFSPSPDYVLSQKQIQQVYHGLDCLKNYRTYNYLAFAKIMKKHDKNSRWNDASSIIVQRIAASYFYASPTLQVCCFTHK